MEANAYALGAGRGLLVDDTHLEQLVRSGFALEPTTPVVPMKSGNINRSARFDADGHTYVLQELNTDVFTQPDALMENTERIIECLEGLNQPTMRFIRNVDGGWLVDLDGISWRCYEHVAGVAETAIRTPEEAQATARVFGRFAHAIADLELVEHLPGYHDFDARVAMLEQAVERDAAGRLAECAETTEAALRTVDRLRLAPSYAAWAEVPQRNAHNDAKAPNCVIGESGTRTVIDLDTTMPGTILADIGELVRSATRVIESPPPETLMFQIEAVNRGFLAGFDQELTDAESAAMLLAGPLLTTENALRFLADHLSGDTYYVGRTPGHNLERAQAQLALADGLIEAIESAMAI